MIGKRVILILVGIAVLLALSTFAVVEVWEGAKSEDVNVPVAVTASTTIPELEEESDIESSQGPLLEVSVTEYVDGEVVWPQSIEVFLSEGYQNIVGDVGENDNRSYLLPDSNGTLKFENVDEEKRFVVTESDVDVRNLTLHVVGSEDADYAVEAVVRSIDGATTSHTVTMPIQWGSHDTFTFRTRDGGVETKRVDYKERFEEPFVDENIDIECDYDSLESKLKTELENADWDFAAYPETEIQRGVAHPDLLRIWSLGDESQCAVALVFSEVFMERTSKDGRYPNPVMLFGYDSTPVEVAGRSFVQQPADGPTGSSNLIPSAAGDEQIQFIQVSRWNRFIPVLMPQFVSCPCEEVVAAVITEPIRIEEE